MTGKRDTSPLYYEKNRLESGLNHIDCGRVSYHQIPKDRWEAAFGPEGIRGYSGTRRLKANSPQEHQAIMRQASHSMDDRGG